MNLLEQARKDAAKIVSGEFSQNAVLVDNQGNATELKVTGSKHNNDYDEDGAPINQTRRTVTLSFDALPEGAFNEDGNPDIIGYSITLSDAHRENHYTVAEQMPDYHLGLLVLNLKYAAEVPS